MTAALEKVVPMLAELSAEDRDELRVMLDRFDGEAELSQEEWEEAWGAECERRLADFDAGRTQATTWEAIQAGWKERRA